MQKEVESLIAETIQWREFHRSRGNHIEAAACSIRLKAFKEVLEIIKKNT